MPTAGAEQTDASEIPALDENPSDSIILRRSDQIGCVANLHGFYYNLYPLQKTLTEGEAEAEVYQVESTMQDGGKSTIQFNLCEKAVRKCPDQVADNANMLSHDGKTCIHLSQEEEDGWFAHIDEERP